MTSTRSIHRSRKRSLATALVVVAAIVAADFRPDEADGSTAAGPETTTPGTTTVTDSTEPQGTTPPVEQADGSIDGHIYAETCVYRDDELIVDRGTEVLPGAFENALGAQGISTESLGPLGDGEFVAGLELYRIDDDTGPVDFDSFEVAELLDGIISASPNYIVAFAPGWKYAPNDTPIPADPLVVEPLTNSEVTIAVLDTGFAAGLAEAPSAGVRDLVVPNVPDPHGTTADEVFDGVAAGHGTFIVYELGQLLPGATITPATTGQRYDHDDQRPMPTPTPIPVEVAVRDDSTVTAALDALSLVGPYDYLNLSFGAYGCTGLPQDPEITTTTSTDPEVSPQVPVYKTPLGLLTVLKRWAESTGMQVFAASGNDSHLWPSDREIFYPAGWASRSWLYSVASDPGDFGDYSNRGLWVEHQARGSRVVSYLPVTAWGDEGWYSWSGTSFATPCALAAHVARAAETPQAPDLEPASMGADLSATDPFADRYTECLINAVPAE